jgi:dTDP-glucose 4,6-dehydratase
MNIIKIVNQLGWQPRYSLETGLRETVTWYLNHSGWVEAIRKQSDYHEWIQKNYANRGEAA